jgi:hypothetical protein
MNTPRDKPVVSKTLETLVTPSDDDRSRNTIRGLVRMDGDTLHCIWEELACYKRARSFLIVSQKEHAAE